MKDEEGSSAYILSDFIPQKEWAKANLGLSERTIATYRAAGLPFINFGGRIYIGPREDARAWLLSRVKRMNQRRAG